MARYKQQKYNLLREETEGYSKLTTEILSNMGPGVFEVSSSELEQDLETRVPQVLGSIESLIGYFDLDPNRVLDIILDIFTSNVTKHHPFFLRLFQVSPWNPKKLLPQESLLSPTQAEFDADSVKKTHWVVKTVEDVPEEGASVIGQILGFKFSYYNVTYALVPCNDSFNLL
jgi:THO complex subunit 2